MFGTCLTRQVTGHQLVPVRGHHQFHSDGHLVVCLSPLHPGGYQFPNQLGAHGIIIIINIIISLTRTIIIYHFMARDKKKKCKYSVYTGNVFYVFESSNKISLNSLSIWIGQIISSIW